jgi:hypothetical protein
LIQIFEEKVAWNAERKIDANNDEAIEKINNAPKKKVCFQSFYRLFIIIK